MLTIRLPDVENVRINSLISDFVEARSKDSFYIQKRLASKPLTDIRNGCKGEFFASKFLSLKFENVPEPDLRIFKSEDKSWACDIPVGDLRFHVKTCTDDVRKFTSGLLSWTFQVEDHLFSEGDESDWIVLVKIGQSDESEGKIVRVARWCRVERFLQEPSLLKYRGLKKCLNLNSPLEEETLEQIWTTGF